MPGVFSEVFIAVQLVVDNVFIYAGRQEMIVHIAPAWRAISAQRCSTGATRVDAQADRCGAAPPSSRDERYRHAVLPLQYRAAGHLVEYAPVVAAYPQPECAPG